MSAFALSQSAIGGIAVGFALTTWSDYLRSPTSDITSGVFERRSFNNMHLLLPIVISYRIGSKGMFVMQNITLLIAISFWGLSHWRKSKGRFNCIPLNHCNMQSCDRFIVMIKIICFAFFYKEAYRLVYLKRFIMFCFIIDLFQITLKLIPI